MADLSSAEQLARVREQLESGWPAGLTALTGDDLFRLDAAQKLLLQTLAPAESSEFALTALPDERTPVGRIVAAARSMGMFSPRRVVFVSSVACFDGEPDALEAYAAAPPPGSYLIVRALDLDQRFKLHKVIAKKGRLLRFASGKGDPEAAVRELQALAASRGLALDPDALEWVASATQGDLYRVNSELDKLEAWRGDSAEPVSGEVARQLVAASEEADGWEIGAAILARNSEAGLAAVRTVLEVGKEPLMLLGGLAWYARLLVQTKAMQAGSGNRGAFPREGWHVKGQLLAATRLYSLEELLRFPEFVRRAERGLKGGALPPYAVLEQLVLNTTARPVRRPAEKR